MFIGDIQNIIIVSNKIQLIEPKKDGGIKMKLGFVSAILDQSSYEEMMDTASELGFQCVEVACWPQGKAERRYAGVSHIDAERVLEDEAYAKHVVEYSKEKGVEISSLAYYPNTMDADLVKRAAAVEHLKNLIKASAKLGVGMVTTFIGRDQSKTVEENLELVKEVWPAIIKVAEENDVKIGIENCPMLFGPDQWPGGQNLMTTPGIWKKVFEILPSKNLGINYDPSHFVWQMIDYIKPIYEFKNKIFHVHYKDIKVYEDKLNQVGIMAYPLEFMSPKLPGLGNVDWGKYVSALTDIGYDGYTCIEVEDKAFEGTKEKVLDSLKLSKRYMEQFVI
jgi:sugar phosphate isomerase/epimerase